MASRPRVSTQEREWRAQEALSTLTRAETIRTDRTLMRDVQKYAQAQVKTLSKVAGKASAKPATRSARKKP